MEIPKPTLTLNELGHKKSSQIENATRRDKNLLVRWGVTIDISCH